MDKYAKVAVVKILAVFWPVCHVTFLKRDFFDIDLTTFFGIRNFGNTCAMKVIFLFKMFKI